MATQDRFLDVEEPFAIRVFLKQLDLLCQRELQMIEIESENLLPFTKIPSWCENKIGNRIHPATINRWRLRGSRGIRLESVLIGGRRYTSEEALARFFASSTAAADGPGLSVVENSSNASVQNAKDYLKAEGIYEE